MVETGQARALSLHGGCVLSLRISQGPIHGAAELVLGQLGSDLLGVTMENTVSLCHLQRPWRRRTRARGIQRDAASTGQMQACGNRDPQVPVGGRLCAS